MNKEEKNRLERMHLRKKIEDSLEVVYEIR